MSEFATNIQHHPLVPQPIKQGVMVSQVGFDGTATQRQFQIVTKEKVALEFKTPSEMLRVDNI